MNKFLLTCLLLIAGRLVVIAQPSLTPINPPNGFKYSLYNIAGSENLAAPTGGANQNWNYTINTLNLAFGYEVVDPSTVPANYITPVPATDFVIRMKIAPTPEQDPMEFFDNTGNEIIKIGQKGSNSNPPDVRKDTLIKKGAKLGDGVNTTDFGSYYYGWGTLTINGKTYDSVMLKKVFIGGFTDTAYYFYQTKPFFHYVGLLVMAGSSFKGMQYYLPELSSSIENSVQDQISIYPNPVSDKLYIDRITKETKGVSISNLVGAKLMEIDFANAGTREELDLSALDKGIYFLNIINSDSNKTIKFIKQ